MFVKLKNNVSLDDFFNISFGTDRCDTLPYYEWYSLENLRKPTSAKIINGNLCVDTIGADDEICDLTYENEDKDIWEIINT